MFRVLQLIAAMLIGLMGYGQCPNVSVIASDTAYCATDSVRLTALSVPVGASLEWNIGSGYDSSGNSYTAIDSTYGPLDVYLRMTLSSGVVCVDTFAALSKVRAPLLTSFDASRLKLCHGADTIKLYDRTPNSVSRSWVVNGAIYNNTDDSVIVNVSGVGKQDVTLIAYDSFGCATAAYYLDTIRIIQDINLSFTFSDTSHCLPVNNNYTAVYRSGTAVQSISWYFEGATNPTSSQTIANAVNYQTSGVFDVELSVTTTNGCVYTYFKPDTISLGESYVLGLSADKSVACLSEIVTYTQTNSSAQGNFLWNVAPGIRETNSRLRTQVVYRDTGYHSLSYTLNHNGCVSTVDSVDIIYIRGLKAGFSSTSQLYCDTPHTVSLINTSDTVSNVIGSFRWNIYSAANGQLIDSSDLKDPSFTFQSFPMRYDVELVATDTTGCSDTVRRSDFIRTESFTFDIRPRPPVVCVGGPVKFINNTGIIANNTTNTYQWTFYDSDSSTVLSTINGRSPSLSYSDTGKYSIKVIATNGIGCKDSVTLYDIVSVLDIIPGLQYNDTIVCFQDSIYLKQQTLPDSVNMSYRWTLSDPGGTLLDSSLIDSFTVGFDQPGAYKVRMEQFIEVTKNTSVCRDTLDLDVYANGVKGNVALDIYSGCSPLDVRPEFMVEYNDHIGTQDSSLSYIWTVQPSTGAIITDANTATPTFTFTEDRLYRVSVFVTNASGCSYYDEKGAAIRVGVEALYRPNSFTHCVNNIIKIGNRSKGDPTRLYWSVLGTDNYSIDSLSFDSIGLSFGDTGVFNLQLIADRDGICADTLIKPVTITDFEADFTLSDSLLFCAPQSVDLFNASTNVDSLLWFFGDGDSLRTDTSRITHSYQQNGIYNIRLIALGNYGCRDTLDRSAAVEIVGPVVTMDSAFYSGCEPLLVDFQYTTTNSSMNYMDYGDGTAIDTASSFSHDYNVLNADSVHYFSATLWAEDDSGCTAMTSADSIVVYARPQLAISVGPDSVLCVGEPFDYQVLSQFASELDWYLDDVAIGSGGSGTILPSDTGLHMLRLEATNYRACSVSDSLPLYVKAVPPIEFDSQELACAGQLFSKSLSAGLNGTYRWDMGEPMNPDNLQSSADPSAAISYATSGIKRIVVDVLFSNGCEGRDSVDVFVVGPDLIPTPQIKFVTVNQAGTVDVHYTSSTFPYFGSYEMEKNGSSVFLDPDRTTSLYTDNEQLVVGGQYCFSYHINDHCGAASASSRTHCAVVLDASSVTHKTVDLSWTPYVGWDSVGRYAVYRTSSTGDVLLSYVPSTQRQYTDSNLCEDDHSYYVVAECHGQPYLSQSNIRTIRSVYLANTRMPDVLLVTVVNETELEIRWALSDYAPNMTYELNKFEGDLSNFIGSTTTNATQLIDQEVNVFTTNYLYTVQEIDACQVKSMDGQFGRNILLTGDFVNAAAVLNWTAYAEWTTGVQRYELLIEEDGVLVQFAQVPGNVLTYQDAAIHKETANGKYKYVVRAIGNNGQTSYSNYISISGGAIVFVPNAFSPNMDDKNELFRPFMRFTVASSETRPTDYDLKIFNRWGEMVFQTNDRDQGWNGEYRQSPAPQGVYLYRLKVTDVSGRSQRYEGTVTLLR